MSSDSPSSSLPERIRNRRDLWPLITATQQKIFMAMREPMNALFEELGLGQRGLPFALIQANLFEPDTVSGDKICERFPYSSPTAWNKLLLQVSDAGYLDRGASRQIFTVNDKGRAAYEQFWNHLDEQMVALTGRFSPTFTTNQLDEILKQLQDVVNSALEMDESSTKAPHLHQFWNKQRAEICTLHQIDFLMDCLNAFRDDVHLASFQHLKLAGSTWELFTFIWQRNLTDIVDLADRLGPFRGYDAREYHRGLMQLVGQGWIELPEGGPYKMTEAGLNVRVQAENATDVAFYQPWLNMSEADTDLLRENLRALGRAIPN